jgi:hypothetical protein
VIATGGREFSPEPVQHLRDDPRSAERSGLHAAPNEGLDPVARQGAVPVLSGPRAILRRVGELSAGEHKDLEAFARRWLVVVVVLLVRVVREPALAYDLATEAVASARLRWESAPEGDDRAGWLLGISAEILDAAVEHGRVPSTERRRGRQVEPYRLSARDQQEIMRLADALVELPASASEGAAAIARSAPAPHRLRELRLSGLVEAEPLGERVTDRHGS